MLDPLAAATSSTAGFHAIESRLTRAPTQRCNLFLCGTDLCGTDNTDQLRYNRNAFICCSPNMFSSNETRSHEAEFGDIANTTRAAVAQAGKLTAISVECMHMR